MDFDEKLPPKASGIRSLSSSVHSTPDKNGNSDGASRSSELVPDFPKSDLKKETLHACVEKEKKAHSKCKMTEPKPIHKLPRTSDTKKSFSNSSNHIKKQHRKGENPVRLSPASEQSLDFESWVCKNAACRAVLSTENTFCKRCSCCICHVFDDNKDPSLWLTCSSESGNGDSCGLSCHIECALEREKVGVVNLGQLMQLDGSYCCASCGKVSGILGSWRKQLVTAKEARRIDVLCYRIFLSYRLLDGTSRFKDLHEIVRDAKTKLESEVGPVNGVSAKMARGIVSRLSVAGDVQQLCSLAIDKADQWMSSTSSCPNSLSPEGSLPAACKFLFEEVTSSSLVICLIEVPNGGGSMTEGYKMWYCKSRDGRYPEEPSSTFPKSQRRFLVSNLQPCTEYTFRIISYTKESDLGHSEAKCFTKSKEIIPKPRDNPRPKEQTTPDADGLDSGFKVRELGRILQLARAQKTGGLCSSDNGKSEVSEGQIPDLNEEIVPPFDCSRDENGFKEPGTKLCKMPAREELHDCDGGLVNDPGSLDENFEYCVKIICWLEREGHVEKEFRMRLLTWFSLRSTEQERRVVLTFIQTLVDDPVCLAGQLVHSFSDIIVSNKRPRNGFCNKLWH